MALRNMLDGDGQDQYDAGGWCFPKPIPPVQRNGDWIVRARRSSPFLSLVACSRVDSSFLPSSLTAAHLPFASQVMDPMMPINTNEAFVENLREYPNEKYPKKKKDWQSVQGGSILTICKLHPSMRPPMVRPGDDNELGAQDVEEFIKNLVEKGQPVVKTDGLGKGSLSSGKQKLLGAPEGVDQNNFDGQRQFDGSMFGL